MKLYTRVFIPDTHTPFEDPKATAILLDVVSAVKPDEILYLGDWWDLYSISSHGKNPRVTPRALKDEVAPGRDLMDEIERRSKARNFVFLEGNHEERIKRYIGANADKLDGIYSSKDILKIPKYYRWYDYGQSGWHQCGPRLIATHGTLYGKHCAMAMKDKYGVSVIFGHTHRVQRFTTRNVFGQMIEGINVGWLGDKHKAAEYVKNVAEWTHAFAIGYFKPNGEYWIDIVTIENYQAVVHGKFYTSSKR